MVETVKIHGFKELNKALKEFPATLQKRALKKATLAGARLVAVRVKALAPEKSGALKRAIKVRFGKRKRPRLAARFIVGVEHGKVLGDVISGGRVRTVNRRGKTKIRSLSRREKRGEDPFYFRFQELGFRAVGKRRARRFRVARTSTGRIARRIPGKRFLTRGFQQTRIRAIARIRTTLRTEIAKLRNGK